MHIKLERSKKKFFSLSLFRAPGYSKNAWSHASFLSNCGWDIEEESERKRKKKTNHNPPQLRTKMKRNGKNSSVWVSSVTSREIFLRSESLVPHSRSRIFLSQRFASIATIKIKTIPPRCDRDTRDWSHQKNELYALPNTLPFKSFQPLSFFLVAVFSRNISYSQKKKKRFLHKNKKSFEISASSLFNEIFVQIRRFVVFFFLLFTKITFHSSETFEW